nr:VENN motif pre-toxin domain-containing protein [Rosenbergiella epipactidis]
MAHAVVNAALSLAKGENALAGASSAVTAEAVGLISEAYYDKKPSELDESQKQTISALASLAAGLAGGLVGGDTASAVSGMQTGKVTVENNYLNSNDVIKLNKELENADKNGSDKLEVYEKFAEISKKNREEAVAKSCSGDPFCASGVLAEAEAGTDVATSLRRLPIFSSLNSDDLSQLDRFVLAENEESARAIYQSLPEYVKVALYTKEAGETIGFGAAVGGKGLSALGVIGKGGKGSPLPTLKSTTAANGLNYQSNPKHTPGQQGYSLKAGTEPKNSISLFGNSIEAGKKRYSIDSEGNVHQFTNTNDGTWHWSGSTGDKTVPLKKSDVPNSVKKEFGLPGKWR